MSIFEHNHRARIYNPGQHPYKHPLSDFAYTHDALPGVTNLETALNYVFAVLYPRAQDSVANVAALPASSNTIGDFRVVNDDGDGRAAGYQWQQREGDVTAKWYKIYDMDWGTDSVLSGLIQKTLDFYVYRWGYDDKDSSGVAITGTYAGQRIYGGASASTNLTLSANSGDGVGANTGYVQTSDHFRPTANNTLDLGTTALKHRTGYFGTSVLSGTLTLASGAITDSSGAISFDNENLTTTGNIQGANVTATSQVQGATVIGTTSATTPIIYGSVSSGATLTLYSTSHATKGKILFGTSGYDEANNQLGVGNSTPSYPLDVTGIIRTTTASGGIFFISNAAGSPISMSNFAGVAIDFWTGGQFFQLRDDAGTVSTQLMGRLSRHLMLTVDGSNVARGVRVTGCSGQTAKLLIVETSTPTEMFSVDVSGNAVAAGYVATGNVRLTGNSLISTNTNGNVILDPDGSGLVELSAGVFPTTDSTHDIGKTGNVWNKLWLDGSIGDGTTEITSATLQSLRDINSGVSSGMSLFYNGSKWVASAPDTEIDHGTITGLADDDHTQYLLLAGRSGGQSAIGGTAASNNLTFESTSHGTKGKVLTKDTFASNTDASFSVTWSGADLGGSSNRFRHLYTAGEAFGLRLENRASDDTPAAANAGRLWWNTTTGDVMADTGTAVERVSIRRYMEDTSWDGATTTKNVTVSGVSDARLAIWALHDNADDFERLYVTIKATSTTNVRIIVTTALPAGSYRLIGLE